MNDFIKKTFAYDVSASDELTDMVVSEQGVLYRHIDDWGNEWETASCDAVQDVAFLKGVADR